MNADIEAERDSLLFGRPHHYKPSLPKILGNLGGPTTPATFMAFLISSLAKDDMLSVSGV